MMNLLKYAFLGLALALSASASAHAGGQDWKWNPPKYTPPPPKTYQAPEIDCGMAISGLTLLGGVLTVVRARRSRR
jgi:hypothetical protein